MKKSIFFIAILFSLISCKENDSKNESKSVFRYNESVGITSLDPAFAKDKAKIWACNQIYNGLIQLDNNLKPEPCIAKSWEIQEDGSRYVFHLRNDVFFHTHRIFGKDSTRKVVAQDFVYSFNRIVDANVASPGKWVFNNVKQVNGKYQFLAPNDSTFIIELTNSFPPFIGLLSMQYCSVVPKEIVGLFGKDFRRNPIGTGPFKFKLWKEGVKLVFVKNQKYFETLNGEKLPFLDAIAITFIIDQQSAFLEFIKGNLDFISGIHASYKDELLTPKGQLQPKYKDRIKLYTQPYLNTEYLGFLMDDSLEIYQSSPTKYKKVRQAINYGFDREKMMMYLRNNIGSPAHYGFIPMGLPPFDSSVTYGYNYNPDKSRQLLSEAGFPNGEGLGSITISTNKDYLDLCNYIQHQLNELGIKTDINVMPSATLRENMSQSKVSFFRGSWIADYPDAENYLSLFYSKNFAPNGPNYTHFHSSTYDELYSLSQKEVNDSLRFLMYRKMDSIIMEEAAIVPLYYDQVLRFTHNNIIGLESNPMNLLKLKKVRKYSTQ